MNPKLRALAALLTYPEAEMIAALGEIDAALDGIKRSHRPALQAFLTYLREGDLLDLQEQYVGTFDTGRAGSLHLFEHVHGDSRDRGQAMVDLGAMYAAAGCHLQVNELPDYLPAVLEFLSVRPQAEAQEMLVDCAHILRRIGERLQDTDSPYFVVFAILLDEVGEPGLAARRAQPVDVPGKTMDEEWADIPAFDGMGGCSGMPPNKTESVLHFMPKP